MRRLYVLVLIGLLLAVTSVGLRAAAGPVALRGDSRASTMARAAPSASPTLGSTPQPGVNPPGDADADPSDFDQVPLIVISFLFLGMLVGGSILFYLWRRSRRTREPVRQRRQADEPEG